MSFDQLLQSIQDFRSQLEVWGVTNDSLLWIAALAGILFVLSLREVVGWYLRLHQLRDEIRELRLQIQQLRLSVESARELPIAPGPAHAEKTTELKPDSAKFRLDH